MLIVMNFLGNRLFEPSPIIFVILRGGLGNQLHQISAGVNLALRYNAKIRIYGHIVDHANNPERKGYFRDLDLEKIFFGSDIKEVSFLQLTFIRIFLKYRFHLFIKHKIVTESNFYNNFQKSGFVFVKDWFQSSEFLPSNMRFSSLVNLEQSVNKKVTIHVRLTDFLSIDSNPLRKLYYQNALLNLDSSENYQFIECYSDDIDRARELLNDIPGIIFPETTKKLNAIELLSSLANTSVLICSKSSLCWWAAQIVQQNGGTVFSPFENESNNSNWFTIPNN